MGGKAHAAEEDDTENSSGCGCRSAGRDRSTHPSLLLVAALLLAQRRHRRAVR
jgi:MYXO-CTERM domain-containing protein